MRKAVRQFGLGWLFFAVILVILFGFSGVGLIYFKFFAPRYENVRRSVFEGTKSYTYGMVQDLARYKYEWEHGDEISKKAIEQIIRMRFANFSPEKINNPVLRDWFIQIIKGRE